MVENLSEVDIDTKFAELPRHAKERLFYREAWAQEQSDKEQFIRDVFSDDRSSGVSEIVWLSDEIQIVKVYSYARKNGERVTEYSWKAFVDKREISWLMPDMESAFLKALEIKYLGLNSQFTEFACKMLGKKLWDDAA